MPRRKQSTPRLVKGSGLVADDDLIAVNIRTDECDVEVSCCPTNGCILPHNKCAGRSPAHDDDNDDDDDDDDVDDEDMAEDGSVVNVEQIKHDHFHQTEPSSWSHHNVSQNSMLPSPPSAVPVPLSVPMSVPVNEMARCERFPKNTPWNTQQIPTQPDTDKCMLCSSRQQDNPELKHPVEGKDYFIDSDGTLEIKNGVCPRSLAFLLFSQVYANTSKYSKLFGENLVQFLLNLKQIICKYKEICPGEDAEDYVKVQNVLNKFSCEINRTKEQTNNCEKGTFLADKKRTKNMKKIKSDVSSAVVDNFLGESLYQHQISSSKDKNTSSEVLEPQPSQQNPGISSADSIGNNRSEASESGSIESPPQVTSPAPSLSSVTSGLSLSEKSKHLNSTKRGCKIMPVSCTDGQSHYLCPVCSLELTSDHELTVHIRSHNQTSQQSVPNTCTICWKTLSSQSSLDRHMLVHSGERPFKCKICDMSFTTNGNMHRHSRIHEKNGLLAPKQPGRKHAEHKVSVKEDLFYHEDSSSIQRGKSPLLTPGFTTAAAANKIDYIHHSQQLQEQNMFLQQYYRFLLPYGASHHPAFPYSQLMQHSARISFPFFQAVMDPVTLSKYAQHAIPFLPVMREPSPDLRAQQRLSCSVCGAEFNNQFSLESHMETHVIVDEKLEAEGSSACKSCKTVAKSEASLLLHHLKHHKTKTDSAAVDNDTSPGKHPSKEGLLSSSSAAAAPSTGSCVAPVHASENAIGFQDLGFASFTGKKFPLIAKAYCESHPSTRAVKYPVYQCQRCEQEFPVEGAKHLHEASHEPEEYTVCPECDCHFSDPTRLQRHMQKHVADMKFEETRGQTDLEPELLTQYHFLALLGLTPKEELEESLVKVECQYVEDSSLLQDGSMLSDSDNSKVIQSDSDGDHLESGHASGAETKTKNCDISFPKNFHHHGNTSDLTAHESNSSTASPLKDSQNLSQSSQGFPQLAEKLYFFGGPKPADCSPEVGPAPTFSCKYCSLQLSSQRALKCHLYTHKSMSQFQCKVCHYSSTDKNTLFRHMRTHSGERPYKCVICEYSFTTKANCERHLRQKHGLSKGQLSDKLAYNKHIISSKTSLISGELKSNLRLQNQNNVMKTPAAALGLNTRHVQQPTYTDPGSHVNVTCHVCKIRVASQNSLIEHMKAHHPDSAYKNKSAEQALSSSVGMEKISTSLAAKQAAAAAVMISPPPAHIQSPLPSTQSTNCSTLLIKQEFDNLPSTDDPVRSDLHADHFSNKYAQLFSESSWLGRTDSKEPLDFSQQHKFKMSSPQKDLAWLLRKSYAGEDDQSMECAAPVDLSVSRSSRSSPSTSRTSHPTPFIKDQDQHSQFQASPDKSAFTSVTHQSYHDSVTSPAQVVDSDDSDEHSITGYRLNPGAADRESCQSLLDMRQERKLMSLVRQDRASKTAKFSSSSESDSSCELASVNKMLDATDAQKFQNFLLLPTSEDQQDEGLDECVSSDEDSNTSMDYMSSSFQSELSRNLAGSVEELAESAAASGLEKGKFNKTLVRQSDPSNMSQQAIADLIEKVTQESASPVKKKKNSYADSPHKFSCQFCPRCFPWQSSLNRHLLTHTGQKPFKCPRCPVTFSTKSNRERHLIRKHNVNMLDPASRSTMDRPYKCHICMFSSFSTKSNLFKHYKDKHAGSVPPKQSLGPDKQLGASAEWEDGLVNGGGSSYEDEEEYNKVVEMQAGMSDKQVLLESYVQDMNNHRSQDVPEHGHQKQKILYNCLTEMNHAGDLSKRGKLGTDKHLVEAGSSVLAGKVRASLEKVAGDRSSISPNSSLEHLSTTAAAAVVVGKASLGAADLCENQQMQCHNCDQTFPSAKLLVRHLKTCCPSSNSNLPFLCSVCELSFSSRVECLIHYELSHQDKWAVLKEKNEIGNIQVFAARMNKMIDKQNKRLTGSSEDKHNSNSAPSRTESPSLGEGDHDKRMSLIKESSQLVGKQMTADERNGYPANGFTSSTVRQLSTRKVQCAFCPRSMGSLEELKQHMYFHTGKHTLHPAAADADMSFLQPPTDTETDTGRSRDSSSSNLDMLHNLLGVESSTIDQIFEATDSAASLLGVCP